MKNNNNIFKHIDFSAMSGKSILITGATGLIGYNLVNELIEMNRELRNPIIIYAHIRNKKKAELLFGDNYHKIRFIIGDINEKIEIEEPIDYIVHAASQTSSKGFINNPVETIKTAIGGTINILNCAVEKKVAKFVYLSTMEVYGNPKTDEKITEMNGTNLNTMAVRSCYPESKRLCENICVSYMEEYGIPVNVIRLTQTFGPGVSYNDGRVFAEFARCAIENRDIVLHTKGDTKRNYLYTRDAISAILTVMLRGESGKAYNAANEETYCSIYEMAQLVADKFTYGKINVIVEIEDEKKYGFAPTLKMNLDTTELENLGWSAKVGLEEMFGNLIEDMKSIRNIN